MFPRVLPRTLWGHTFLAWSSSTVLCTHDAQVGALGQSSVSLQVGGVRWSVDIVSHAVPFSLLGLNIVAGARTVATLRLSSHKVLQDSL